MIEANTVLQYLAVVLMGLGLITLIVGIVVMIRKSFSRDISEVSKEVNRLAQKGILSEMNGTMESASFLVREMTSMLQTAMGIGCALVFIGAVLLAAGVLILLKLTA